MCNDSILKGSTELGFWIFRQRGRSPDFGFSTPPQRRPSVGARGPAAEKSQSAGVLGWGRQAVYRVLVSSVEQPSSHVFFVCSRKTQSRGGADPLAPRVVPTGSLRAAWRPRPSTPADFDFLCAGPLAALWPPPRGGVGVGPGAENPKSVERPRGPRGWCPRAWGPVGSLRAAWRPHPSTPADCDFSAAGPL